MQRFIGITVLSAIILFSCLGLDVSGRPVDAASSVETLDQVKASIHSQLEQQLPVITVVYSGDRKGLTDHMDDLLRAVFAEDDYIAYTVDSYLYTIRTWGRNATIKLRVNYLESAAQTRLVEQKVREVLPQLLQAGMGEKEKVRAIHDWIVTHVAYDATLTKYTAYDALVSGTTVCQGYALLAERMLRLAGIDTRIVEGTTASGSHVWNLVKVDGHWYHMDVTWDDPMPDRPGQTSYAYFLKTDAQFKRDHHWTKQYPQAL